MRSFTCRLFWETFKKLPKKIRNRACEAYDFFSKDPNYPSLDFKKIKGFPTLYSAEITESYRALGVVENNDVMWFWIGPHDDYMNKLKNPSIQKSIRMAHENLNERQAKHGQADLKPLNKRIAWRIISK